MALNNAATACAEARRPMARIKNNAQLAERGLQIMKQTISDNRIRRHETHKDWNALEFLQQAQAAEREDIEIARIEAIIVELGQHRELALQHCAKSDKLYNDFKAEWTKYSSLTREYCDISAALVKELDERMTLLRRDKDAFAKADHPSPITHEYRRKLDAVSRQRMKMKELYEAFLADLYKSVAAEATVVGALHAQCEELMAVCLPYQAQE
ncbi:hypothetical protein IWZ00DRAFT_492420 [Phyllosticta capitalensis]